MEIITDIADSGESWRNYCDYELTKDFDVFDELYAEEQSLYENGYISANELYFGKITDETGE